MAIRCSKTRKRGPKCASGNTKTQRVSSGREREQVSDSTRVQGKQAAWCRHTVTDSQLCMRGRGRRVKSGTQFGQRCIISLSIAGCQRHGAIPTGKENHNNVSTALPFRKSERQDGNHKMFVCASTARLRRKAARKARIRLTHRNCKIVSVSFLPLTCLTYSVFHTAFGCAL